MKLIKKGNKKRPDKPHQEPVELFKNNVVKEQTYEEITKDARRWSEILSERNHQTQLQRKGFKQQRILNSKEDKKIHALDIITERIKPYYPQQKDISIDYYYFNYEDRMDDSKLFEKFLEEAKNKECFEQFSRTNCADGIGFSFFNVDLKKITKFKEKLLIKLKNLTPSKTDLRSMVIKYDDDKAILETENRKCQIPPYKNEHFFCRAMYEHDTNEPTDWSVIYEKITGYYEIFYGKPQNIRANWRLVYDAMEALNKRVKHTINTDDDLFTWQEKTAKRNY